MATFKKFAETFEPYGHEHNTLKNIHKGELTEPFNCERYGLDAANLADIKMVKLDVGDEFKRWKQIHRNNVDYISIDCAEAGDDAWVIQAFLTPTGTCALDALEKGLVWHNARKKPDLGSTYLFYDDKVRRGILGEKVWGPVMALAREYPDLRPLRAKIVYLRMQGDMKKGVILKPPVELS